MTPWLVGAVALIAGMGPLLFVVARADTISRLVGLEVAAVNAALVFVLLAQYFGRSFYTDEAVVLALLSVGGGLVFARVLERWL